LSGFVDPGIITGIAATLIGTIAGAFLTYTLSKTQRRNERLIEGIYRPLLGQLGQVLERIQDADSPDLKGLDAVRQDGMYFVMNETLKKMTRQAYDEIKGYKDRYGASSSRARAIVRELVQNFVPAEDLDKYRSGGSEVTYRGFIDHAAMGSVTLQSCLLIGKTPVEWLIEKSSLLRESHIDCNISGHSVGRHLADEISDSALQRADLDPLIRDTRSQRQLVLRDLEDLIKTLSAKIL
jgi:hypothetical protein